jgi:pilus assembly protein CpaE
MEHAIHEEATLTIALFGPDEDRRKMVADTLSGQNGVRFRDFPTFPAPQEDLQKTLQNFDVAMIDVDYEPNYAFDLVESICASGRTYVMAYSAKADMRAAVHFMRAGIHEFLALPLDAAELAAALGRASTHQAVPQRNEKSNGRLFVFLGTKGGCGVTTLAANFALALAQESDRKTLLIDLGLPLGDVAINLGMVTEYSIAAVLQHPGRLDGNFLASLLVKHSSGLSVLAAPSDFLEKTPSETAIDNLLRIAREEFDYVVVDAGSRVDLMNSTLFSKSASVYLITQVGISEMLTANRMITKFFATRYDNLQIVLNRFKPSDLLFDESQITKALTRPAQWKIPDDYAAARRKRETATPMVLIDSAIAQAIREMAKTAAGLTAEKNGKKGFFSFLR